MLGFPVNQSAFAQRPADVVAMAAVAPDDPVTGQKHRQRIGGDGVGNGACRPGPADGFGEVTVTDPLAAGDTSERSPDRELEWRACEREPHRVMSAPRGRQLLGRQRWLGARAGAKEAAGGDYAGIPDERQCAPGPAPSGPVG